ncbi:MAG: alpha/beta hydrolase [Clostridiaceae bacterium]|nr:alpha/beta hydrolase [Clostridiaceae bacterium]
MNHAERTVLNALTNAYILINSHYKLYRKVLGLFNPRLKPLYHLLDHRMTVNGRDIPVRVFRPRSGGYAKVLIFFHGGGWIAGNIDTYTRVCARMADQTGHIVISVNYRLAPENPFPAGLEDCYHVTREIFQSPYLLDCEKENITLIGDSAGGNLAAAVSLMARDRKDFLPPRQILLYPATYFDHSPCSPFPSVRENGEGYLLTSERVQYYMDMYVQNEKDKCNPYVAPLLAGDFSNQPKTLVITAEYDPLRDEGEAYGHRLRQAGNDASVFRIEGTLHGFLNLPVKSKAVRQCYDLINAFLRDTENACES